MQTSPVRLIDYFDGRKQSVIPLYQRPYTWKKENWDTLWRDILDCYEPDGTLQPHFMGAIVSLPASTMPIGVNKHLIIDGQQRLTTVSVLLCALRKFIDERERNRIQDFLINRNDEGVEKYKLMPTQADRNAYTCVVSGEIDVAIDSQLFKAHSYFNKKIKDLNTDDGEPSALQILEIIESALRVVMISLDREEDPYEIFESLNFKGTSLSPADLVRNYILMQYRHSLGEHGDQERIYRQYWSPIEDNCPEDLPQFLLHYLRLSGREVRKKSIYPDFKLHVGNMTAEALEGELGRIKKFSAIYPKLLNPTGEAEERVSRPLKVFEMLGVTVFYPLLLKLFLAESEGTIAPIELYEGLDILVAYLIRRSVCNLKNNALDMLVTQLLKDWREDAPASFLKERLSEQTGNLRWPKDIEFEVSFVNDPQYGRKSTNWVLWRLEDAHGHKEGLNPENIQTEHIFPQHPNGDWPGQLTPEDNQNIEHWIDTYGNLTLTGYNPELGNKGFESKRQIYKNSHFEMTKAVALHESWGVDSIRRRGEALSKQALQVWQGPVVNE